MPGCCAWGPGCPGGPGAKVVKRKSLSFTTRSEDTERGPLTEKMMFNYMAQKQSNGKAFSIHLPVLFPCLWVKRLCALESPSRASPLLGSLYLGDKEPAGKQCLESLCVGGKYLVKGHSHATLSTQWTFQNLKSWGQPQEPNLSVHDGDYTGCKWGAFEVIRPLQDVHPAGKKGCL